MAHQGGRVAVVVPGDPQVPAPESLALHVDTDELPGGEDGRHGPTVGRDGGRRPSGLLEDLRGRAARGEARDTVHVVLPEELAGVRVVAVEPAAAGVGTGQEEALSPDDGGAHAVRGHRGLPEDVGAVLRAPGERRVRVERVPPAAGTSKAAPALGLFRGRGGEEGCHQGGRRHRPTLTHINRLWSRMSSRPPESAIGAQFWIVPPIRAAMPSLRVPSSPRSAADASGLKPDGSGSIR